MKYTDLQIQTQREAPNNARTEGFAFLARAGYLTRENQLLPIGEQAISRLKQLLEDPSLLFQLSLPLLLNDHETFFPLPTGDVEIAHCESCKYTERLELAQFKKKALPREEELPLEKVLTPDCNTIESLANFLGVPKEKTAKALMYTRVSDGQFVFIVVRGDMQLSEAKLRNLIGEIKLADAESVRRVGAEAGFASPIGLTNALIVVDELIPKSKNLVAGANEAGYHLKNTNHPRDYAAEIIADVTQAKAGDPCVNCGNPLSTLSSLSLATSSEFLFENILLALAETHHDEKGLALPKSAAPFDVYLMHVPGKTINTAEKAEEIYNSLQSKSISVLFDNRDERAGVKFNDADLIGCPIRVTVGEKAFQSEMVELKLRKEKENQLIPLTDLISRLTSLLQ
ncbi:MAG: YbaK/EbsC family protein [Anaerolineales bacterium]